MLWPMSAEHEHNTPLAIGLAIGAFVILNGAFYWLSGNYFDAHPDSPADKAVYIRKLFAITSGILPAVNVIVGLNRRVIAHVVAALLGVLELCAAIWAWIAGEAPVVVMVLLIAGVLMPMLAWFSYRRKRAPWAFLMAICSVFAVTALFGAPRIGRTLSLNLWITLILPGLYALVAVALVQLRGDYVERDVAAA